VIWAGLASDMSCAAADVISDPAAWMSGCIRGASDSRLKVESEEGKVRVLADKSASICSIEDCMMLARAFNSAKASRDSLRRTQSGT